jgi:uncharacterized membrane protein
MGVTFSTWTLGAFFVVAGLNHFLAPGFYLSIMPPYLGWHLGLIYISGVAEIAGGIGVLIPRTRVWAGWGLLALLVAVFPANIHAALNGMGEVPRWALWLSFPCNWCRWPGCIGLASGAQRFTPDLTERSAG